MKKMKKIFEPLKLEKEQEKWLVIGFITMMLLFLFYVMPVAVGILLISDLPSPILRVILITIFGVITIHIVHFTFKYGLRACVRLAIKDYEIRQKIRQKKKETEKK